MDFVDYYKILEVQKKATADEIKKSYRTLARKYHPDTNPNDATANKKFQQINEANEVLSDPEKRSKYDKYGKDWQHSEAFEQRGRGQQYNGGFENDGGFSDFFSSMFGSQRSTGRRKGQDINATFEVKLSSVFTTHQQTITVNNKNIRITIPAGIAQGQVIKLAGYGEQPDNGATPGDLYLTFNIKNDSFFKRVGNDLEITQELDLYTAVLGGELEIQTLHGKLKLKVKPLTQNNTKIRAKGKGFAIYKQEGSFGDLYIIYQIKLPTKLTPKQIELFTTLQNLELGIN